MIKSQKDQGNQLFKNGKYSQAIKHYQLYVQQRHQDNQNAYFNLSLCYSKLGKHKESVEAAEKAISLNPNYTKCYYRLALENKEIGNRDYQVFINASIFLRLSSKQQITERQQMKKLQKYYKNKKFQATKDQKISNLNQIVNQTQKLMTQNQLRIEVDKEITQWVAQWNQNTQGEQAKLLEIRYIMEEIDYEYGLNVAFFYLNQLTNKQQKLRVQNQINLIRTQLNRQQTIKIEQLQSQEQAERVITFEKSDQVQEDDDQNLFETDEKVQQKQQPKIFPTSKQNVKQTPNKQSKSVPIAIQMPKINSQIKNATSITSQTQKQNNDVQSTLSRAKTPKQRIQQLLKNKQKVQEYFGQNQISLREKNNKNEKRQVQKLNEPKDSQKQKMQQKHQNNHFFGCNHQHNHNHNHQPVSATQALQRRKDIVEALKNAFPEAKEEVSKVFLQIQQQKEQKTYSKVTKQEQKKSKTEQIQQFYDIYCSWLTNEKNKFVGTYKCVLKILESSKISSITKGELLILLKKRIKNFLIIMRSNSQNQQKVLYSLLEKYGIEQYAKDITPLFHIP